MYRNRIKRVIAIIMSLCGIICLSWLYIILIIAIKIDSPGPVFFKQKRVGIHKKHFQILKFRTMRIDTPHDMPTHMLENPDQYITKVGHFLRKTSLDELPQLFNILVGIDVKAKLDGYYVQHMSFWMDVKCFFGTIASVIRSEGVVEGGTGTIHAKEKQDGKK